MHIPVLLFSADTNPPLAVLALVGVRALSFTIGHHVQDGALRMTGDEMGRPSISTLVDPALRVQRTDFQNSLTLLRYIDLIGLETSFLSIADMPKRSTNTESTQGSGDMEREALGSS